MAVNQIEIHNERGIELANRGWKDEAIKQFQKAIALDPSYAPAHDNIASLYAEKGDYLRALQIYLKAIELEPDSATVRYNFGCFISNYAVEIALSEYQLAIEQDAEFPEAHLNLGISLASQGRIPEAIRELKTAEQQDPDDAQCPYELACIFAETGQPRKAIREFRKAIKKDPEYQPAWFNLGSCYFKQGFYSEAKAAFKKALELDPNNEEILSELDLTHKAMSSLNEPLHLSRF